MYLLIFEFICFLLIKNLSIAKFFSLPIHSIIKRKAIKIKVAKAALFNFGKLNSDLEKTPEI